MKLIFLRYYNVFITIIKENWKWFVGGCIVLLLFFIYNFLPFISVYTPARTELRANYPEYNFVLDNSPDGTANYRYISQFARNTTLAFVDDINSKISLPVVVPRSVRIVDSLYQIPTSFIGMPLLFGTLAKLFGMSAVPFYLFIFTLIGLGSLYYIVQIFFEKKTALLTVVITAFFPAVVYWQNRSLMHNMLFVDLWLIGTALCIYAGQIISTKWQNYLYGVLSGLVLGMALMVRSSEVFVLVLSVIVAAFISRTTIKQTLLRSILILFVMCAMLTPVFLFNIKYYGTAVSVGYATDMGYGYIISDIFVRGKLGEIGHLLRLFIAPFGFDLSTIINTVSNFIINNFWYYLLLFVLGFIITVGDIIIAINRKGIRVLRNHIRSIVFFSWFVFVSLILILLYGSWNFFDNTVQKISIGDSHTRYWLPIYIFVIPYVSYAIMRGWNINWKNKVFAICIVCGLVGAGVRDAFLDKYDGLISISKAIDFGYKKVQSILSVTEENAVISQVNQDKNYIHVRRVMPSLEQDKMSEIAKELVIQGVPVYWHYFTMGKFELWYFNEKIKPLGIYVRKINNIRFDTKESLYKIEILENNGKK